MIVEGHFAPLGSDNSMHFMSFGENLMGRLVTNWIGHDGWMLKFDASHRVLAERINLSSVLVQKEILGGHGVGGDTVVGRAEVVNKFVDDGNHFVDLVTWTENLSGQVWQTVAVTVQLPIREDGDN